MRKVRTALDTSIRTKGVRSFKSPGTRGHVSSRRYPAAPGTVGWRTRGLLSGSGGLGSGGAARFRQEAKALLTPSQRRQFEMLPEQAREELLLQTEKKIERRISAGRYGDHGTPAGVNAAGSARVKGRESSRDPLFRKYSETLYGSFGLDMSGRKGSYQNGRGRNAHGYDEDINTEGLEDSPHPSAGYDRPAGYGQGYAGGKDGFISYPGYRRRKNAGNRTITEREKRLKRKKEAAKKDVMRKETGKDGFHNRSSTGEDLREPGGSGAEPRFGSGPGSGHRSSPDTGDRKGRKITRDYAKVLGRLVESQVRLTQRLESGRSSYQRQQTIKEMEEKEAKRAYRIVSFSLSAVKSAVKGAVKAVKLLASQGKKYLIVLLLPVILMVMMVPLLLSSLSLTQEEATANALAAELVEYALQWVGVTQYIWGEGRAYETDWQDYTDCSGYVHGVFSHFGYEIGGDTVSMEGSGTLIQENGTDRALPGDIILFFSGGIAPGNSTHVGIYIGGGQMVHCSGGRANVSPETAGPGVMVTMVAADSRPYQVRRIIPESAAGGIGTGGHTVDPTNYSQADMELIWAIVAQEDNGSYEGALAVISSAMSRAESPVWGYLGGTAMQQLCAPGQYCYSNDHYWEARLGGNVPEYVKQAVYDCLKNGIRNHGFTCFRSTKGAQTGPDAVQIGGNWFFGN